MEGLQARGIEIFAAYGNTPTDSRAYKAVGIPDVSPAFDEVTESRGQLALSCGRRAVS